MGNFLCIRNTCLKQTYWEKLAVNHVADENDFIKLQGRGRSWLAFWNFNWVCCSHYCHSGEDVQIIPMIHWVVHWSIELETRVWEGSGSWVSMLRPLANLDNFSKLCSRFVFYAVGLSLLLDGFKRK